MRYRRSRAWILGVATGLMAAGFGEEAAAQSASSTIFAQRMFNRNIMQGTQDPGKYTVVLGGATGYTGIGLLGEIPVFDKGDFHGWGAIGQSALLTVNKGLGGSELYLGYGWNFYEMAKILSLYAGFNFYTGAAGTSFTPYVYSNTPLGGLLDMGLDLQARGDYKDLARAALDMGFSFLGAMVEGLDAGFVVERNTEEIAANESFTVYQTAAYARLPLMSADADTNEAASSQMLALFGPPTLNLRAGNTTYATNGMPGFFEGVTDTQNLYAVAELQWAWVIGLALNNRNAGASKIGFRIGVDYELNAERLSNFDAQSGTNNADGLPDWVKTKTIRVQAWYGRNYIVDEIFGPLQGKNMGMLMLSIR